MVVPPVRLVLSATKEPNVGISQWVDHKAPIRYSMCTDYSDTLRYIY